MYTEKDWITKSGLRALVMKHDAHNFDFRCGYVAVPKGHPLHGMDYNDVPADVHGGLTYSDNSRTEGDEGLWWFGYDCGHAYDCPDIQTLDYCTEQCESLASQLMNLPEREGE